MTRSQVTYLRSILYANEEGKPLASKSVVVLDDEHIYRPDISFVWWEDDKELVHVARANDEFTTQTKAPIMITSGYYGNIQYMEGGYNLTNFMKALSKMSVPEKQYDAMVQWAMQITNQAKEETRSTPYYTTTAKVIPNEKENLDRDDGKTEIEYRRAVETNPRVEE